MVSTIIQKGSRSFGGGSDRLKSHCDGFSDLISLLTPVMGKLKLVFFCHAILKEDCRIQKLMRIDTPGDDLTSLCLML